MFDLRTPLLLIEADSSASALEWAQKLLDDKEPASSKDVGGASVFSRGPFHIYVKGPLMITHLDQVDEDVFIQKLNALSKQPSKALNAELKRVVPWAQVTFSVNLSEVLKALFNVQSEQTDRILGGVWMTRERDRATLSAHIRIPDLKALNQLAIQRSMHLFMR